MTRTRPIPHAQPLVAPHGRTGERPPSAGDALPPRPDPTPHRERQDGLPVLAPPLRSRATVRACPHHPPRTDRRGRFDREPLLENVRGGTDRPPCDCRGDHG